MFAARRIQCCWIAAGAILCLLPWDPIEAGSIRVDRAPEDSIASGLGFFWSSDSSRLIYRQAVNIRPLVYDRLVSVALTGGEAVDLAIADPVMGSIHEDMLVSPDGQYVVYVRDFLESFLGRQLFVSRLDGSERHQVTTGPENRVERTSVMISPDSSYIAYMAQSGANDGEVPFLAQMVSGTGVPINPDPVAYVATTPVFSPTGASIVYTMLPKDPQSGLPRGIWNLNLDSQQRVSLASDLMRERKVSYGYDLFPADDELLVFARVNPDDGEWFAVPLDGGSPRLVTAPDFDSRVLGGGIPRLGLSADGSQLFVIKDATSLGGRELWRYSVTDGRGEILVGAESDVGVIGRLSVSDASGRVVFANRNDNDRPRYLYSVPMEGGPVTQLVDRDGFNPFKVMAEEYVLTADGRFVVFRADFDRDQLYDLYSVSIEGGPIMQLSAFSEPTTVNRFEVTPNGQRVIYVATNPQLGSQAYSVPVSGGTARWISGGFTGELMNFGFGLTISSDGTKVAFAAQYRAGGSGLHLAPVLPGDIDFDGHLSARDVDLLAMRLTDPAATLVFDLDDSGVLDSADHAFWIRELKDTWFGDANLDNEFNSGDFVQVFQAGKYETGAESGWSEGNWNGDGLFDSSDFVTAFTDGGYELGPRTDVAAVPEPSGTLLLVIGLPLWVNSRRTRRAT